MKLAVHFLKSEELGSVVPQYQCNSTNRLFKRCWEGQVQDERALLYGLGLRPSAVWRHQIICSCDAGALVVGGGRCKPDSVLVFSGITCMKPAVTFVEHREVLVNSDRIRYN